MRSKNRVTLFSLSEPFVYTLWPRPRTLFFSLLMVLDSVGGTERERKKRAERKEGLVDFPMKFSKLPETCPEYWAQYYFNKGCQ